MSKPLVLTCDIGTQSARALLVDPDGRIVDVVQSKYAEPYFSKEPGWAEQKPNFYFDRLCECCRELCARSNALLPDVIAMTITVIRDTVVCLDANNEPLRDIILWLDKRTVDPNGAMPAKNMMLFKVAGMEPTAKVVYAASVGNWIMRHEPEIWARTAKYVMLPTYLNYKLTGNLIDSASNQIGHIPFDYKNRRWMKPGSLTRCFCDVPNEKLCDLVPSGTVIGTVTDEVCALTGIPAGLPLISTGSDKGCETLGLAVVDSDKASISLGTTATIQFSTTEYVEPQQFLPAYPGVLNDHYNPEIEIYRGLWLLSWFVKEFGTADAIDAKEKGIAPEALLDERIRDLPAGSDGLHPAPGLARRGHRLFRLPHALPLLPRHHRGPVPGAVHGAAHHGGPLGPDHSRDPHRRRRRKERRGLPDRGGRVRPAGRALADARGVLHRFVHGRVRGQGRVRRFRRRGQSHGPRQGYVPAQRAQSRGI